MKKLIFLLFIILSFNAYSQSPSNFTYQSVVRDGSGKLLSNKEISFRISVLKNSESGQVVFEEEHSVTTNINGLATLIVGKGSGNDDLGDIDWGDGSFFLKVEIDPEGGFNFIAEDTTQLLSVPYALYSSSSGSSLTITGQDYLSINNNEITVNKVDLTDDVEGILPVKNGGTGSSTAPLVGVITAADAASARNVLGLSTVASSGSYNDLTDKLIAGANITIINGEISSTNTDTNTFREVQADGTAIGSTQTLNLKGGTNVTLTENAGEITIDSPDTNTFRTVQADGTAIGSTETLNLVGGTNVSLTESNGEITIASANTFRTVQSNGSPIGSTETLNLIGGSNITLNENNGAITIGASSSGGASSIDDLSDGKSEGADFTGSMILGHETTGTLNGAEYNTAVGIAALDAITTGDSNTAVGFEALSTNTTGGYNTAVGFEALSLNTTGNYNTALGQRALEVNTTGTYNTATGTSALISNTTGSYNTALGYSTLVSNTTGTYNTASGYMAMRKNTTGTYNTATGTSALRANTTGGDNTASGYSALYANTTGSSNVALGTNALASNTTGGGNTSSGTRALLSNTTGSFNTASGYGAGDLITTGSNNTIIGYDADPSVNNASNQIVIGKGASGQGNNYAVIGNADVTRVYAADDAGAVVYAGGINLSGGTTVSGILSGTLTMSTSAEQAFTISGVTSNSIVTVSFKSGDNGRYIQKVVPSTDTITITLDGAANNGVIMYIIIN